MVILTTSTQVFSSKDILRHSVVAFEQEQSYADHFKKLFKDSYRWDCQTTWSALIGSLDDAKTPIGTLGQASVWIIDWTFFHIFRHTLFQLLLLQRQQILFRPAHPHEYDICLSCFLDSCYGHRWPIGFGCALAF